MRRLLLVFLMLLLPLQWSWVAAASVCEHESGNAHFGHHEHQHSDAAASAPADVDVDHDADSPGDHPDCQACHGLGMAFAPFTGKCPVAWSSGAPVPGHQPSLPDPPVDNLLRPPLNVLV